MHCAITIVRYPKQFAVFGFLSMAVFHLFLRFNPAISFYKLMGCGKNGAFDIKPDARQWCVLAVFQKDIASITSIQSLYGKRIANWWKKFQCEIMTVAINPIEGHGKWDGKECFGKLPKTSDYEGTIAVLTRASIRLPKLKAFWKQVSGAADAMLAAPGYITSFGVGEVPWIKQATFSVWQSKELMRSYAYGMQQHRLVIQKTRKENWYSEEMFVRFTLLWTTGSLKGKNDLIPYL